MPSLRRDTCSANPFTQKTAYGSYPSYMSLCKQQQSGFQAVCQATNRIETPPCDFQGKVTYSSTKDMVAGCKQFCPPHSFPVLLGSPRFGFDFSIAAQTYGTLMNLKLNPPTNALLAFDQRFYQTCLGDRDAFYQIQ